MRALAAALVVAAAVPAGAQTADCRDCHRSAATAIESSFHGAVSTHEGLRGCETCHRGAGEHGRRTRTGAADPGFREDRSKVAASCALCHAKKPRDCAETNERWRERRCLDCHHLHVATPLEPGYEGYAGDAACRPCHASFHEGRPGHPPRARDSDDPLHTGCEACHGPSADHAAEPAKVATPQSVAGAAACARCHEGEHRLAEWRSSTHARRGVACLDCHPAEPGARANEERCATCHPAAVAEFRLPSRHRLLEGRIACADCHEPHGGARRLRNEEMRVGLCVGCHPEKSGPFVFEHEGDRLKGCLSCHLPHGSPNARLLTHSRSEDLCAGYHPVPACFHLHEPGSIWRKCLRCHTAIHGSNWSHELFR